jgi:hypothetical protein
MRMAAKSKPQRLKPGHITQSGLARVELVPSPVLVFRNGREEKR